MSDDVRSYINFFTELEGTPVLNSTFNTVGYYTATQLATLYSIPAPNPSVNVTLGVLSFEGGLYGTIDSTTGILTNGDVHAYWSAVNPGAAHPTVVVKGLYGASINPEVLNNTLPGTIENTLDVQTIGAICPSSKLTIVLYVIPSLDYITNFVVDYVKKSDTIGTYRPTILNISWGSSEQTTFLKGTFTSISDALQLASENGLNICSATGDNGSIGVKGLINGTDVGIPQSSPYVISVGGTTLVSNKATYSSDTREIAWLQGGGGISQFFPTPIYQSLLNVPSRSIPDLAANASVSTGMVMRIKGQNLVIGGTSLSVSIISGFLACLTANNTTGKPLPFLNPYLYSIYANPTLYTACFRDIKYGSNGLYFSKTGYDTCTGLGTIKGDALAKTLYSLLSGIPVTSLTLSSVNSSIAIGLTISITTIILPQNASIKTLVFVSSNPSIASVDSSGIVTAHSVGTVTITGTTTDGTFLSSSTTINVIMITSLNPYIITGPTGLIEPLTITRAQLNEKKTLVTQYTELKFQSLLTLIVNYHVESTINEIIQILINNTGQTSHLHYLQVPPGKIMDQITCDISTVNYDSVKIQAIPLIIQLLQSKFSDSAVTVNKQKTYVFIDWAIPK